MINKEESKRLHIDWWGKCRTCRFWKGTDNGNGDGSIGNQVRWNAGPCTNPSSVLYQQETWTEGYCPEWDSFDIDTALEILQEAEDANLVL